MRIKRRYILKSILFTLFASFWLSFFQHPTAHAYTCDYSGKSGNGKEGQYKLEQEGIGGSCYYMSPDQKDNSKKKAVVQNGQIVPGQYTCTDGTVFHGEDCYTYKKVYTAYRPTYDDGTAIDNQAFQNACQDQPTYFGMHYNYDPKLNACSAGIGCMSLLGDSGKDRAAGGPTGLPIGDCRRVGAGTATAGDVLGDDPTTERVRECTGAGASFNAQTHQCDWTEQTCSAKNNGQGIWDKTSNQCMAYTDFTNEADCRKAGGAWQQDPNDATHWECNKPGTGVNSGKDAQGPNGPEIKPTESKCGEARVNIIVCDVKTGKNASRDTITDVLKIILRVLTVLVGAAAVGGMAFASIQYARAADESSIVSEAKNLIRNIIIGVVLYGFLIAIVNWLIPGGVFG